MAADYPGAINAPRTKENKAGVVYDAGKKTIGYAEDIVNLDEEVVAIETELGTNPKATSDSVKERLKGIRSLSDADADVLVVKGVQVGIGTAAPQRELHVSGTAPEILLTDSDIGETSKSGLMIQQSGVHSLFWNWETGGDIYFGTENNTRMTILDNGNVGIGTTSPKSKLHVVGLSIYANNAAAITGGLTAGAFYRTGADPDLVCVVH